jgi:hypothetical protein
MKHFLAHTFKTRLLVAAIAVASISSAQQPAAPTPVTAQVKIKTMPKPDKVSVQTPDFQFRGVSPQSLTRKSREWAVIDVTYETKTPPKSGWTDNVTASFYVLAETMTPERQKEVSFYTLTVRYVNVPDGDHRAGVVLAPSTLERFGKVVAIACEITADGAGAPEVKSEHTASELNANKDDWWKNPKIVDSPITKKRDGLLLERSKTIFGLINPDDYEAVK